MIKFRYFICTALAGSALAVALPAAAGTLSPQLRALAASYHKAPKAAAAHFARIAAAPQAKLFMPHVSTTGSVQVYLHYQPGAVPSRTTLDALGARHVLVSYPLGVVQVWIPIAKLHAAAALAGITTVGLPVYAYTKGSTRALPATDTCSSVPSGLAIDNEGITAENVAPLHKQGIEGQDIKVGIISSGIDCISSSQAAGYLPSNIYTPSGLTGSGDEGTAMLEEVHAIAPDAALGFCGPATTVDFLECLDDFAAKGFDVISDDLGFFPLGYNYAPFADPNTGGNAITEFAQAHSDITLTTAAGNDQEDYYEADYKADTKPSSPGGPPISLSPTYTVGGPLAPIEASGRTYKSAMNFGAAIGKPSNAALGVQIASVSLDPTAALVGDLTWNDPSGGPYDDLDLFLLNQDGSLACQPTSTEWCSSTINQIEYGSQGAPPVEVVEYTNNTSSTQTLYLVALCYDCSAHGSAPLHIKLYGFMNGAGVFQYTTNGGISGHAKLNAEITTAAAHYNGVGDGATIEPFSNTGPFTYGDWTEVPQQRDKPDFTGIDGVTVSGAGGFAGGGLFYGTSAASPNVGAVIALLRSFAPNAETGAAAWKKLVMTHANSSALTNYTPDAGGAGLVDAEAALAALDEPITVAITAPAVTSGSAVKISPNAPVQFKATCDYSGNRTLSYLWSFGKSGSGAPPDESVLTPAPVQYANGGLYTTTFTCSDPVQSKSTHVLVAVQAAAKAEDESLDTSYQTSAVGQFKGEDVGGEQVSYEIASQPGHGTVSISGTGFTYTPQNSFSGKDSFTYDINNGVEKSNAATVTITVGAAPLPPPPPPPSGGGGGGGAFGGLGLGLLAGLSGLLLFRRRRR